MSGVQIPVGPFYGALYFSVNLSVGFYGVTCMQTFFYCIHYQDDEGWIKAIVAALWMLNTIHEALIIGGVYKYIIVGLVNPLSFINVVQELIVRAIPPDDSERWFPLKHVIKWQLLFLTLVLLPTQAFFIYRIYIFSSKNIAVPLIWLPLGLWEFVGSLLYIAKAIHVSVEGLSDAYLMGTRIAYYAVAAAVDIAIAGYLTYLLMRRRIASEFKSSARILQLLAVFAINSGIWTATCSILHIILMHVYPNNLTSAVFDFPLCAIYCNTLLANLNARAYIKSSALDPGTDLITNTHASSRRHGGRTSEVSEQNTELSISSSLSQAAKNYELITLTETVDTADTP